jgi:hypothetical protein
MTIVNTTLISNPISWIIVFLMVAIAYIGAGYIIQSANLPKN